MSHPDLVYGSRLKIGRCRNMLDRYHPRRVFALLSGLLPPTNSARKITLLMLLPVLFAYAGRVLIHQVLEYERSPYGLFGCLICPFMCLIGVGLITFVLWLAAFSVRRARHVAPAFVLLGGVALVPFLPLPPLPLPVFPEEEFFLAHRAEFEQVVAMARQDNLDCLPNVGCNGLARALPSDYAYLSIDGYILVSTIFSLEMKFWPIDFYYPVIYLQVPPEDRTSHLDSRCWDSRWVRKLDEHWYLCVEEWN